MSIWMGFKVTEGIRSSREKLYRHSVLGHPRLHMVFTYEHDYNKGNM